MSTQTPATRHPATPPAPSREDALVAQLAAAGVTVTLDMPGEGIAALEVAGECVEVTDLPRDLWPLVRELERLTT